MTIPVKKISTFCKTGSGGTPSRSNNAFFENGTIPWVKSGELKNRYITEVEEYITDLAVEKSSIKALITKSNRGVRQANSPRLLFKINIFLFASTYFNG
jgi:type I restriction enzyme, S subunit